MVCKRSITDEAIKESYFYSTNTLSILSDRIIFLYYYSFITFFKVCSTSVINEQKLCFYTRQYCFLRELMYHF